MIEDKLKEALSSQDKYNRELTDAMNYTVFSGGKRWRPLLVLAIYEMLKGPQKKPKLESAITAACAIELIHSASIVHDDLPGLMNRKERRGKEPVHEKYGNALAILSGIASPSRAEEIISWIEQECAEMRKRGDLAVDLPPNFFPFIKPGDPDWRDRYSIYNKPGDYHNGGIWPFIAGLYVAALVAAKKYKLAEKKLMALTHLIKTSTDKNIDFGFNEWLKAQDGKAMGQNWQTWSAALYLYAVKCVEEKRTPFFDKIRI